MQTTAPLPSGRFGTPAIRSAAARPTRMEFLDRITDIYFHEEVFVEGEEAPVAGGEGAYAFHGRSERLELTGTELAGWVDAVARHIREAHPTEEDFRITVQGVTWRCCRDRSDISTEISMRQITDRIPMLNDLVTDSPPLLAILEHPILNDGGLVVISGLTGSGKTTLCGAMLNARLRKFGGRCVSVEDPAELPLEGTYGGGVCRQMAVRYDDTLDSHRRGFAGAVRRAYRKFPAVRPAILYVGEVRDEETAVELLKASSNGMLVITTVHAEDPIAAITRIAGLASVKMGDGADVLLAQALRLSIHTQLEWLPVEREPAGGGRYKRARSRMTAVFSSGSSHAVAQNIRQRKYQQINQSIETQMGVLRRAAASGQPVAATLRDLGAQI